VTELAGYTSRVAEMFEVFNDMQHGRYVRNRAITTTASTSAQSTAAVKHIKYDGPMDRAIGK